MGYSYLFPLCYLEHLDSLRLRHTKRLMSWVRLYTACQTVCFTCHYLHSICQQRDDGVPTYFGEQFKFDYSSKNIFHAQTEC